MAEGLEPHHHIIRRAGPTINKHLNLSDEALVTRLIANGCISEKDKDKYSGKTKRVRDRFIARFQNQPYELFLAFVECLRADMKYAELVAVLDEALAEYGYVPPTRSHDASSTTTQTEDTSFVTIQEPSPLTTELLSVTLPSGVVTETSDKVTVESSSTSVDTVTVPSLVVTAANDDYPTTLISSADDVVTETVEREDTKSSDVSEYLPQASADDDVVIATSYGKGKKWLQRQEAFVEEDESSTYSVPVSSGPVEDVDVVTEVMSGLRIATRGGDYPRLPFEGDRETMTFTSEGGELFSFTHKFRIVVPPNAVPPGNHATLHVTGYCRGPFQLPTGSKPCSDFIFVEMEGIDSFQLPATVEISHNLVMENYASCREVSICHCECDGSFITASPSHQYPIVFKKITEPNVSNTDNVFSFELKTFCGLCAVYDESASFPYLRQKATNSTDRHSLQQSHSGETPLCHSLSGENPGCNGLTANRFLSINSQSSCGSIDSVASMDSSLLGGSRKRKLEGSYSAGSQEKQTCRMEYTILCYWPVALRPGTLSVVIFVCKNCFTSLAACRKQVAILSGYRLNPVDPNNHLNFNFDESRRVSLELEIDSVQPTGWAVHKRSQNPEVHEDEVLGLWDASDGCELSEWLKKSVEHFQYPPRIILDVHHDKEKAVSNELSVNILLNGIYRHSDGDRTISLYLTKSDWLNYSSDTTNTTMSNLTFPSHEVTSQILVEVSMEMSKFALVALHLGLQNQEVDRIREEYVTFDERCYQTLQIWWGRGSEGSLATLEELHTALCRTDQGSCLPEVLSRHSRYNEIDYLSQKTDISKMTLNRTVNGNDTVLTDIAAKLAVKWRHVGRVLGLEEYEIDEIQHDYRKVTERAYQMLRKWREKKGSDAKMSQLVVALLVVRQSSSLACLKE